ncbi:MAG TPA: hypothetical protein VIE43_09320 [Thermoanaerobaculia bacterium]|jgi:hypothetical protein|nr:hypothetical protein [Thermoanaerobaculia bacterium]
MARVLASSGVERTPLPPESSYLGELARTLERFLADALLAGARALHVPAGALWAVVALLAALVVLLIGRALLLRRRRRPPVDEPDRAARMAAAVPRDAAGWRAELERRLAGGEVAAALEALWWWLARSLAGAEAEPDWTSRDLVARSAGRELRDLVRRLDAFTYGPRPPAVEDLRGLVGRLEEALA